MMELARPPRCGTSAVSCRSPTIKSATPVTLLAPRWTYIEPWLASLACDRHTVAHRSGRTSRTSWCIWSTIEASIRLSSSTGPSLSDALLLDSRIRLPNSSRATMVSDTPSAKSEGPTELEANGTHCGLLASRASHPCMARGTVLRHPPKVRALCGSVARWDPCGGGPSQTLD